MTDRWTAADRVLLGATVALLAAWPGHLVYGALGIGPLTPPQWAQQAAYLLAGAGCSAAWAAVAWRCSGAVPRGLALGAAVVAAALAGALVADATALPWVHAVPPGRVAFLALSLTYTALWVPAVPLLALCPWRGGGPAGAGPRAGRRAADWWLLGATVALLAGWPALVVYAVCVGNPAGLSRLFGASDVATATGSFAAWAAVAWRCRGPVARGFVLAAALGYAAVGGGLAVEQAGPAWSRAAMRAGWGGWTLATVEAARFAAWVPAVPLLALARRPGGPAPDAGDDWTRPAPGVSAPACPTSAPSPPSAPRSPGRSPGRPPGSTGPRSCAGSARRPVGGPSIKSSTTSR